MSERGAAGPSAFAFIPELCVKNRSDRSEMMMLRSPFTIIEESVLRHKHVCYGFRFMLRCMRGRSQIKIKNSDPFE